MDCIAFDVIADMGRDHGRTFSAFILFAWASGDVSGEMSVCGVKMLRRDAYEKLFLIQRMKRSSICRHAAQTV